jgi:hypothetical protein
VIESAVNARSDYFVGNPGPRQANFTLDGKVLATLRRGFSLGANYFV